MQGLYLLGGFLALKGMVTVPVLLTFMEYYAAFVNHLLGAIDIVLKKGEQAQSLKRIQEILKIQQPERPYKMEAFEKLEFRENLLFGRKDAAEAEMEEACARANIMYFIRELPLGRL